MYIVTIFGNNIDGGGIMNMKDLFSNKKRSNKSVFEFLNRKGFYIVLVLGLLVVGVTVFVLTKPNLKFLNFLTNLEENYIPEDFEDFIPGIGEEYLGIDGDIEVEKSGDDDATIDTDTNVGIDIDLDIDGDMGLDIGVEAVKNLDVDGDMDTQRADSKNQEEDLVTLNDLLSEKSKETIKIIGENESSTFLAKGEDEIGIGDSGEVQVENPDLIMPVYGNIICDYALDNLIYSKTMEDWRVHKGIDIAAARGTAVKAVANGVVSDMRNDPRLGNTVVIDHENGFKTVYSNLASLDLVLPNQIISQGDIIGSVGDTAAFEIALEPHLHFEVLKSNILVDPKIYLPEY